MLCDYGCGQEAKYQFKNGKNCCSKNFRICPSMRNKGVSNYEKRSKKVICEYCKKTISHTAIKKHHRTCYLNPINIKKCKNCEKIVKHGNIFCSKKCSASYNNKGRTHSSKTKKKIRSSILSNYKNKKIPVKKIKCEICGLLHCNSRFCSIECYREFIKRNPGYYKKQSNSDYKQYKLDCMFRFNVYNYPDEFDLSLINKHGWYKASNRGNNLNGISRDHIFSITEGFKQNISSIIISHPANCQLMGHQKNNKKHTTCGIDIPKLKIKILKWNKKHQMKEIK